MERGMRALVLTLLAFGSAFPAAAAADPVVRAEFAVGAGDGYSVSVSGYDDEVYIEVEGRDGSAEYSVPGRVTGRGVWANFGKFGKVAVKFRPSGSVNRRIPPARCEGKPRVTRFGNFVGEVRFRGEGGYVEIDANRGWGHSHVERRWNCSRRSGSSSSGQCASSEEEGESVDLEAVSPRHRASLSAFVERSPEGRAVPYFFTQTYETHGRMKIRRAVIDSGGERSFIYDPTLTSAAVNPPRPFTGSATFQRNADGTTSWTGDLRVSFPGAPDLALAGPSFEASLKRREPEPFTTCSFGSATQKATR